MKCLRKNSTTFICLFSITSSRVLSAVRARIFLFKKQNSHSLYLIWLSTERHLSCPTFDYLINTDMSIDYTNICSRTHFQFHRYIPTSGAWVLHTAFLMPIISQTLLPTKSLRLNYVSSSCLSVRSFVTYVSGSEREYLGIIQVICNLITQHT